MYLLLHNENFPVAMLVSWSSFPLLTRDNVRLTSPAGGPVIHDVIFRQPPHLAPALDTGDGSEIHNNSPGMSVAKPYK